MTNRTAPDQIRLAVVTDIYCDDPVAERHQIAHQFTSGLEDIGVSHWDTNRITLVATGRGIHEVVDSNPDVILLDYGAAAFGGTRDLGVWQVGDGCRWAEQHPGKLLFLWTMFTKGLYDAELKSEYGHLENVVWHHMKQPCREEQTRCDATFEFVAHWLGFETNRTE